MSAEEVQLLAELTELLEKQRDLAQRGSFSDVQRLAAECEPLVARAAEAGLLDKPEHKTTRAHLAKLYRDLQLLLSAQRDAVAEELNSVRRGRKALSIYRGNI